MLRPILFLLLAGLAASSQAQHWDVRSVLANVSSPTVRLTATRTNGETVTVDLVQRQWLQRLMAVTERMAPTYQMAAPEVVLVKGTGANAFVTFKDERPVMGFNTDMLKLVGDDDDLVAAVVGHELGHLHARHLTDGAGKQGLVSLIGLIAGIALDVSQARKGVDTQGLGMQLGSLGSDLVNAKFSRDQEREADDLGVRRMAQAGFNPAAASRLWRLMHSNSSGLFLDSHPSSEERMQAMDAIASQLSFTRVATAPAAAPPSDPRPAVTDPYPVSIYRNVGLTPEETAAEIPGAYRRALEAHRAQRWDEAVAALLEAAPTDERALAVLGDYYAIGERGLPKDLAKARESYEGSAAKGFGPAMLALGELHAGMRGPPVNLPEAVRLMQIADARNIPRAASRLSLWHLTGNGVERNPTKARFYAQRATNFGDPLGKAALGAILREGVGGPVDLVRSFELLSSAADAKIGYASYQLAISYEKGAGTAADKDKAAQHFRQALSLGVPAAKQRLQALGFND